MGFRIVGAGAQGRIYLEILRAARPGESLELLDDAPQLHGSEILGARVVGPTSLVSAEHETLLAFGDNRLRRRVAERLAHARFGVAVHPSAVISPSATLGIGTVVFPGAIVHTEARVGTHVVVNTGVIVEHDCVIEDYASLSPGVRMGGRVTVERGAFVSTGVTLAPRVRVGAGAIVGAGAVVTKDVPAGMLAYGVPARAVRSVEGFDPRRLL